MKTIKYIFAAFALTLTLGACSKDDIDEIRDLQNENAARLAALEQWQNTVNSQITSMQSLIAALEANDFITGVTPLVEGGVEVGYTITFTRSNPIVIRHGLKGDQGAQGGQGQPGLGGLPGADAAVPQIGMQLDADGVYYWTLDGVWLPGASGEKIPVNGPQGDPGAAGQPGQNAVAPQMRIDAATNFWEISVDGGGTWTSTGVVANGSMTETLFGPDGGVDTSSADVVVFTLADGTVFTFPRYKELGLTFAGANSDLRIFVRPDASTVAFTVTGTPTSIVVGSSVPQGWSVEVNRAQSRLEVTAPATLGVSARVLIVATGAGDASASYWLRLVVSGDGSSSASPILIDDQTSLQAIDDNLNAHYRLVSDITLNTPWIPIGFSSHQMFAGTLDGNGQTVTINGTQQIFNKTEAGSAIKNVKVAGLVANGQAALVRVNIGTISGCVSTADINGEFSAGGLVNRNYGTLINCYATGDVAAEIAGGLVANNGEEINYYSKTIRFCFASGSVDASAESAGGIGSNKDGLIENCVALNTSLTGDGDSRRIGSIMGAGTGTFSGNYALSTMTVNGFTVMGADGSSENGAEVSKTLVETEAWWADPVAGVWRDVWGSNNPNGGLPNDDFPWVWDDVNFRPKLYWE